MPATAAFLGHGTMNDFLRETGARAALADVALLAVPLAVLGGRLEVCAGGPAEALNLEALKSMNWLSVQSLNFVTLPLLL